MVRRKHKYIDNIKIYRHYSFLRWYQCCICKYDFRREFGFRFLGPPFMYNIGTWYYVCSKCAKTKEDVYKIAFDISETFICSEPPKEI